MDFFSVNFFIFALIAVAIYLLMKKNESARLYWLIICGIGFLASWNWQSAVVAVLNGALIFWLAKKIANEADDKKRLPLTIIAILSQISLLFVTRFFSTFNLKPSYETVLISSTIFIGVAYYILQNISYVVEVHRKNTKAENSHLYFFSYMFYFPKLLLGPIERYEHFKTRLQAPGPAQPTRALYLISLGLFKRLVISARIMSFYNEMQASYTGGHPILIFWTTAILGLIVFYADFSAYMNIGQGISLLLGIELTENFNQPYFASTPIAYWQRWHITLTNWMRDYVYYPVMLISKNIYLAIFVTFILVGLWHGFKMELIIWGLGWGIFQATYIFLKKNFKWVEKIPTSIRIAIGIFITFNISTLIGLYSYHLMFFKKEMINPSIFVDTKGLFLYKNNYTLVLFIAVMMLMETYNQKNKSNVFYLNAAVILIFLTSAFMISKSYFFYYMRL